MNSFRLFVLLTSALISCHCNIVRDTLLEWRPSVTNRVFAEDLLFDVKIRSLVDCAAACLAAENCFRGCFFLTYTSSTSTCRGHSTVMRSDSAGTEIPGTISYIKGGISSAWLRKRCTSDSECGGVPNATCVQGVKCLCRPGYFYSQSTDSCLSACKQPGKWYLMYDGLFIKGHNIISCPSCTSTQRCQAICTDTPDCITVDLHATSATCCPQNVTVAQVSSSAGTDACHMQRTCV